MSKKQEWTATGRRKRSVAQVRMTGGTGNITVNGVAVYESDVQNRLNTISPNGKIDLASLPKEVLEALVLEVNVNNTIDEEAKKLKYQDDPEINKKVEDYKKELVRE